MSFIDRKYHKDKVSPMILTVWSEW